MTALAVREPDPQTKLPSVGTGFFDLHSFELTQRVARSLAASTLVPKIYQGNTPEAVGNCMIALNFAQRVKADPLMVMQNLHVIQGRPSWSSPFLIALVNICGKFTELAFEFSGVPGEDSYGCRASANSKATGRQLPGAEITIKMAKDEGWYGRSGSKWRTMQQQMLIYRAAAFWARVYAPEVSMGLLTKDEVEDIIDLEPSAYREVSPKGRGRARAAAPTNDTATIDADAAYPAEPRSNAAPDEEGSAAEERLSAAQVAELLNLANEAGANIDKLCEWVGVAKFSDILVSQFARVHAALEAKLRQKRAGASDPNPGAEPPSPAETPANAPQAGEPASSVAPAADDAGEISQETEKLSPVEEARQAGAQAARKGTPYEAVPKKYARYIDWATAWQEGHAAEGERMEAEARQ